MTAGILFDALDGALADFRQATKLELIPVRASLVTANLILAPISDFLLPPVGVANAVLVWVLNAEHVRPAWRGLREKRTNVELLYLTIGVCTLLSFNFFGAAVMYATLETWPRLVRQLRTRGAGQRQFPARYRRCPQRVWIERDGRFSRRTSTNFPPVKSWS